MGAAREGRASDEARTTVAERMSPAPDVGDLWPVLTVEELAKLLRINRDTAYRAVQSGEIPGVRRVDRSIRISRDAVLDWLRGKDRVVRSRR